MSLARCCTDEARASLDKHGDIATCDACGRLLLAYEDEHSFQLTVEEMESKDATFDTDRVGSLYVISKAR